METVYIVQECLSHRCSSVRMAEADKVGILCQMVDDNHDNFFAFRFRKTSTNIHRQMGKYVCSSKKSLEKSWT